MTQPLAAADQASRRHGQGAAMIVALQPASFRIDAGARVALMGPSGSGKSTLLHLLADLDRPSGGTVTWPGLGQRGDLRPRHIGIVFQTPSLLPALSVIENVQLPLLLAARDKRASGEQVSGERGSGEAAPEVARRALAAVGVAALADKLPGELSGGQAQRVGIARAIAGRPALLLADEPTGQLDHATGQAVLDALLDSIAGTATALVLATHDPGVAARLDTVWRIAHGQLDLARGRA